MSDWVFDVLLGVLTLSLAAGSRLLWRRGRTQTAAAIALPVPFLIALEILMIWYTASGGAGGFNGM